MMKLWRVVTVLLLCALAGLAGAFVAVLAMSDELRGDPGPAGEQGSTGPVGPEGPPAANLVGGYVLAPGGGFWEELNACPAGTARLLGISESKLLLDARGNEWVVCEIQPPGG